MGMRVAVWMGGALLMAIGACTHVLYQLHAERERTAVVLAKVATLHAQIEALQGRSAAPSTVWREPVATASTRSSASPELAKQDTERGKSREGSNP